MMSARLCFGLVWTKQVNVIIRNLQREDVVPEVVGSLTEQVSHIIPDYAKNRVAILSGA